MDTFDGANPDSRIRVWRRFHRQAFRQASRQARGHECIEWLTIPSGVEGQTGVSNGLI